MTVAHDVEDEGVNRDFVCNDVVKATAWLLIENRANSIGTDECMVSVRCVL